MAHFSDFGLARYTSAGALDTTFSTDGKVITDFGTVQILEEAYAVAIDGSGRIVVAGYSTSRPSDLPWHATPAPARWTPPSALTARSSPLSRLVRRAGLTRWP